ncbi:MAG: methylmalonyl Co-A mutase-associated GTPase MeaB [Rhodospirillales bacterium]|nr:methylmalonyl Co-A mutase-associated GTPase MeaB [Alphaproteobacteria bacterium]MBL6948152.1 methylmalonyl Co-A mutase-associated GTPase MeaB [Rhodospirillales bacterium]
MAETSIQGVLDRNVRAIARMISLAEAGKPESRALLADIFKHTGHAHVVGLTGVPGSGKSSLVRELTKAVRASGRTVGIVAIDPSSPFSGGAILGDRVRMTGLTSDDGVFIRSMATRGSLGGLAKACLDAVDVLDAAGFDVILIETVGVGQDEVDIVQAAHSVLVVSAPGLGDDIQAIKSGVLEIADIHVVSKGDRPDAGATAGHLRGMLTLTQRTDRTAMPGSGDQGEPWAVPVLVTSAEPASGIEDLLGAIDGHRAHLTETGGMEQRRRKILETRVLKIAEDILRSDFKGRGAALAALMDRVRNGDIDPHGAAVELLEAFRQD